MWDFDQSRRQGALDHVQSCGPAESMHCHGRRNCGVNVLGEVFDLLFENQFKLRKHQ